MERACPLASPPDIDCRAESRSRCLYLYWFEGYLACEVTAAFIVIWLLSRQFASEVMEGKSL